VLSFARTQGLISELRCCAGLRTKWQEKQTPERTTRMQELAKKQEEGNQLSSSETSELRTLCTVEQDIVLVKPEESDEGTAYDADRLREERLRKLSDAEHALADGGQRRAKRDASSVVKFITLRFFADQEQDSKQHALHAVEITIPFRASFAEVCETLRQRCERIVHFRYINDKNVRVEVRSEQAFDAFRFQVCVCVCVCVCRSRRLLRSEQAFDAFRFQVGEEGLEKMSHVVVAQVSLSLSLSLCVCVCLHAVRCYV